MLELPHNQSLAKMLLWQLVYTYVSHDVDNVFRYCRSHGVFMNNNTQGCCIGHLAPPVTSDDASVSDCSSLQFLNSDSFGSLSSFSYSGERRPKRDGDETESDFFHNRSHSE